jgi:hypothetical protein
MEIRLSNASASREDDFSARHVDAAGVIVTPLPAFAGGRLRPSYARNQQLP